MGAIVIGLLLGVVITFLLYVFIAGMVVIIVIAPFVLLFQFIWTYSTPLLAVFLLYKWYQTYQAYRYMPKHLTLDDFK